LFAPACIIAIVDTTMPACVRNRIVSTAYHPPFRRVVAPIRHQSYARSAIHMVAWLPKGEIPKGKTARQKYRHHNKTAVRRTLNAHREDSTTSAPTVGRSTGLVNGRGLSVGVRTNYRFG